MKSQFHEAITPEEIGAKMYENDRAAQWLGIRLDNIQEGSASMSMSVTGDMLNGHSICHGGMIFAFADTAFAYACNSRNVKTVALSCVINFLLPAKEGDILIAEANEVALKGKTGIYDIVIKRQSGEVIAQFRGTSYSLKDPVVKRDQD